MRKGSSVSVVQGPKVVQALFSRPYLLCIHLEVSELLLEELHEGICGNHREANPCLTEPSLKDIGDRTYRRKHKSA